MSKFIEPSVEEIKLEKVYQDMGLSDQEYEKSLRYFRQTT